jgi:hypothetical protein
MPHRLARRRYTDPAGAAWTCGYSPWMRRALPASRRLREEGEAGALLGPMGVATKPLALPGPAVRFVLFFACTTSLDNADDSGAGENLASGMAAGPGSRQTRTVRGALTLSVEGASRRLAAP